MQTAIKTLHFFVCCFKQLFVAQKPRNNDV
jgi:hypothetical protein